MGNRNSDYGFILGVTGHRDASVAKKEELEEHIDDLLEELQVALGHINGAQEDKKRQAYEDVVWALLQTKEFLFNH